MRPARSGPAILIAALLALKGDAAAISLRIVQSASLTGQPIARDIRWAGPGEVFLALGKNGVLRAPVALTSTAVVRPASEGRALMSGRIATGSHFLVTASPVGGFGWIPLDASAGVGGFKPLATVMDVDARGDRVAILGADRGDVLGLSRDGAIAWIGSLSEGLTDMHPLMKGRAHPGGRDMAQCGFLENGVIRFMRDGSLVVVPGVEPGVYQYDERGKLLYTWDTASAGVVDDCSFEEEQRKLLQRDFSARSDWLASRPIIDDVLPLRSGPALLIRRVEHNVSRWEMVSLARHGRPKPIPLPVTVLSPRAHVRGDVRGNQLVLLVFDDPLPGGQPVAPQRVIVLSVDE